MNKYEIDMLRLEKAEAVVKEAYKLATLYNRPSLTYALRDYNSVNQCQWEETQKKEGYRLMITNCKQHHNLMDCEENDKICRNCGRGVTIIQKYFLLLLTYPISFTILTPLTEVFFWRKK